MDITSDLCRIVIFNDDKFSHWVFFKGFVMINAAILFIQNLFPYRERITNTDFVLLGLNALFLGAEVLANLGFEEIGLDLYVVALLALISIYLLFTYSGDVAGNRCLLTVPLHTGWVSLAACLHKL